MNFFISKPLRKDEQIFEIIPFPQEQTKILVKKKWNGKYIFEALYFPNTTIRNFCDESALWKQEFDEYHISENYDRIFSKIGQSNFVFDLKGNKILEVDGVIDCYKFPLVIHVFNRENKDGWYEIYDKFGKLISYPMTLMTLCRPFLEEEFEQDEMITKKFVVFREAFFDSKIETMGATDPFFKDIGDKLYKDKYSTKSMEILLQEHYDAEGIPIKLSWKFQNNTHYAITLQLPKKYWEKLMKEFRVVDFVFDSKTGTGLLSVESEEKKYEMLIKEYDYLTPKQYEKIDRISSVCEAYCAKLIGEQKYHFYVFEPDSVWKDPKQMNSFAAPIKSVTEKFASEGKIAEIFTSENLYFTPAILKVFSSCKMESIREGDRIVEYIILVDSADKQYWIY